jgi:hypothetical protein
LNDRQLQILGEAMTYDNAVTQLYADYNVTHAASSFREFMDDSSTLFHRHQNGYVMWRYLRKELHALLCTKSAKYARERGLLSSTATPAIALLSGLLTTEFGITAGTAGTLAAISLLIPLKMSVSAWCRAYKDSENDVTELELQELRKLADPNEGKAQIDS